MKPLSLPRCAVFGAKALAALILTALPSSVWAIPFLQLDASPATYNSSIPATISTANNFTLYALVDSLTPTGTYYVTAAVMPKQSTAANLGSFVFNGTTINVTSDMTYGQPTDLPSHGVYSTYYKEFSFTFDLANTFTNYDVSLVTGNHTGPVYNAGGNGVYMPFTVDISGLQPGESLWFDLYHYVTTTNNNGVTSTSIDFAPFSHGAETNVPDSGSTLIALGLGLLGLGAFRRRASRA